MSQPCTYHARGTFCSHACKACDRRMLTSSARHQARQTARLGVLMRSKPTS